MDECEVIENAIEVLSREFPGAQRGTTATRGHQNYEALCNFVRQVKLLQLHRCECGRRTLGWSAPEFIVTVNGKSRSIGYDANSTKISCGDKCYHGYYTETPACGP